MTTFTSIYTRWLKSGLLALVILLGPSTPAAAFEENDRFVLGSLGDRVGGTILAARGSQVTLVLSIEMRDAYSAANVTIQLPDGVTLSHVNSRQGMAPASDFQVASSALPNNRASVVIYSTTANFADSSGILAWLYLDIASDAPLGNYPIEIETSRERDIKSYEVRTPRSFSTLFGESVPAQASNCSITIAPEGGIIFTDTDLEDDIAAILFSLGVNTFANVNPFELTGNGFTSYSGDNMGFNNLSGLEYATDLETLSLEMNNIEDIGPLATLSNLTSLSLSGNRIKDLTPISNLGNLETLHLEFNEITDLTPLATLTNLTTLTLSGNYIQDLSPLSGLTNLEMLYLDGNMIADVSPLQGLTNLNTLLLDWNQIGSISPLTLNSGIGDGDLVTVESNPLDENIFCDDMDYLYIEGVNLVHNITACDGGTGVIPDENLEDAVRSMLNSQGNPPGAIISSSEVGLLTTLFAEGMEISSLEGLQYATNLTTILMDDNNITDLSPLAGLTGLEVVVFSNNNVANPGPLLGSATTLRTVNMHANFIGDLSAFAQMPLLEKLFLNDNLVFDLSPLRGVNNLQQLRFKRNQIVDVSALREMSGLILMSFDDNFIGNVEAIAESPSLSNAPQVEVRGNPLGAHAQCNVIDLIQNGGATILYDSVPCSDFIDLYEPDGTASRARKIEPGQMRHEMSLIEIIPNTPDVDWVKFELDDPAQVTIESAPGILESEYVKVRATVYDENLSPALGAGVGPVVLDLGPGTYYVRTDEVGGRVVGNYAVRVTVDHREYLGDDKPFQATPIQLGQPSPGHTLTNGDFGMETVAWFPFDSDPGWTTTGQWAFGTPTGNGAIDRGFPDPTSGATGSNVYGVNLSGDYTVAVDTQVRYVTSTAIDCSRSSNTYLQFERWLNTDYPSFVDSRIEVSRDNSTWHLVWANTPGNIIEDGSWSTITHDISEWADGQNTVYIRWGYFVGSASAYSMSGWNIDDVRILGNVTPVSRDVDWFKFETETPMHLKMRADALFGRANVELFGPNDANNPISQQYVSDNNTMFFPRLPAGRYWVRVAEYPRDRKLDYEFEVAEYSLIVEEQGAPDRFEYDDDFPNATPIDLDPIISGGVRVVKQTHNFHDAGDEDWCVLVIPRKELHPRLELTDLGPRANPVIDVFAENGSTLLRTGTGNVTIDFNTRDNQKFFIRIRNNDPNAFGVDTAYGVSGIGGINIGGFVAGFVRDQFGDPVSGVQLTIPIDNNPDIISSPSGDDGFYTFPNVPLGTHTASYMSPCGLELSVTFTIVDAGEHNVPVEMNGCTDPNEIFVNVDIPSNPDENGSLPNPFSSVGEGVDTVASGGMIRIKGQSTAELFVAGTRIDKPMTLIVENIDGITPVTIGEETN